MHGSVDNLCDVVSGDCNCKPNVAGYKCAMCATGYENFPACTEGTGGGSAACGAPHWKGDKFCDDENNTAGCGWDGGDCCGGNTDYCYICKCLDPNFV